jgi:AcrR family transcriptional regulator
MPRLIDSDLRTSDMVIGVNRVLVSRGIPGLTVRLIARESGISTGSLMTHFESRERMLRLAAHRTGRTLVSAEESDGLWLGVDAFLPVDEEMRRLTRAWLAWCELWRSEPWLESTVSDLRAREVRAIATVHEQRLTQPGLETLAVLLDGLRSAICAPVSPMPLERARELLRLASTEALEHAGSGNPV